MKITGGKFDSGCSLEPDDAPLQTKDVTIDETQIVVDRQSLLVIVRALDLGFHTSELPKAMDRLREPFFEDEISSGDARRDFTLNSYN